MDVIDLRRGNEERQHHTEQGQSPAPIKVLWCHALL
jgi:hypothetical protein